MQIQQGTEIEFRRLQELYFADVNILERIDCGGRLLDLTSNNLRDELLGQPRQRATRCLTLNDLNHLLADFTDLRRLGIGGLLNLVLSLLGEADGEQAEKVVVGCLDSDVGLDQGLPLADKRAKLVGSEVETVEVCETILSLDFIYPEFDLAESVLLILLEIGKRNLENPALEGVVGVLETSGAVDKGLSNISGSEGRRCLNAVPILAGEGILDLLLKTFLSFGKSLVLANSHNVLFQSFTIVT